MNISPCDIPKQNFLLNGSSEFKENHTEVPYLDLAGVSAGPLSCAPDVKSISKRWFLFRSYRNDGFCLGPKQLNKATFSLRTSDRF